MTVNPMANAFQILRTLGVLEHLGSVLLRTTTMLIRRVDLGMVSGSRRRWRRCGAYEGDPYRSRRGVKFCASGSSVGSILRKRTLRNVGRIGQEAIMAIPH